MKTLKEENGVRLNRETHYNGVKWYTVTALDTSLYSGSEATQAERIFAETVQHLNSKTKEKI